MATTTTIAIPLDPEVKQRLERAAAAAGVPADTDEPEATGPGETLAIQLDPGESARFGAAILDPPPPDEALLAATHRQRRRTGLAS